MKPRPSLVGVMVILSMLLAMQSGGESGDVFDVISVVVSLLALGISIAPFIDWWQTRHPFSGGVNTGQYFPPTAPNAYKSVQVSPGEQWLTVSLVPRIAGAFTDGDISFKASSAGGRFARPEHEPVVSEVEIHAPKKRTVLDAETRGSGVFDRGRHFELKEPFSAQAKRPFHLNVKVNIPSGFDGYLSARGTINGYSNDVRMRVTSTANG